MGLKLLAGQRQEPVDYDLSQGFTLSCDKVSGLVTFSDPEYQHLRMDSIDDKSVTAKFELLRDATMKDTSSIMGDASKLFYNFVAILAQIHALKVAVIRNDENVIIFALTPLVPA